MKLINPKNSEVIESPFATDLDAKDALVTRYQQGAFSNPTFPLSLLNSYGRLSESQRFWFHKLAMPPAQAAIKQPDGTFDLSGLRAMFATASAKLKRPAIVLQTGSTEVKIAIAGERSRYTGQLLVSSPDFGGAYYGRIDNDGNFFPGRDDTSEVRELLKQMSIAPAATAAAYGKLTGRCCFCRKCLEDERSTAVGYGPVCAEKFGLDWGNRTVATRARIRKIALA